MSMKTEQLLPRIWVGPGAEEDLVQAVTAGGGQPVRGLHLADAVVWGAVAPSGFPEQLPRAVRWVQLPSAGIERWMESGIVDDRRVWTSAAGAYSFTVAEHALALTLAGLRRIPEAARSHTWTPMVGRELRGSEVLIVGAGGIGTALIQLLQPFDVQIAAVTRRGRPVPGATRTLALSELASQWGAADVIVLCAPAARSSQQLVGPRELKAMRRHTLLVNVARGSLVDTNALVAALHEGCIGGAALDVIDPEPIPAGHDLWSAPGILITPHTANPAPALRRELARRVLDNVQRFASGQDLLARIDMTAGY